MEEYVQETIGRACVYAEAVRSSKGHCELPIVVAIVRGYVVFARSEVGKAEQRPKERVARAYAKTFMTRALSFSRSSNVSLRPWNNTASLC
jgi:hypothetical protein